MITKFYCKNAKEKLCPLWDHWGSSQMSGYTLRKVLVSPTEIALDLTPLKYVVYVFLKSIS